MEQVPECSHVRTGNLVLTDLHQIKEPGQPRQREKFWMKPSQSLTSMYLCRVICRTGLHLTDTNEPNAKTHQNVSPASACAVLLPTAALPHIHIQLCCQSMSSAGAYTVLLLHARRRRPPSVCCQPP